MNVWIFRVVNWSGINWIKVLIMLDVDFSDEEWKVFVEILVNNLELDIVDFFFVFILYEDE